MCCKVFAQPFALRGSRVASTHRYALTIQDYDVPSTEFIAVIAFAWIASGLAKILEVVGGTGGMEFVVTGRRTCAIFQAAPGFVVALEIRGGAVRVSEIADGHRSALNFLKKLCRSFRSGEVPAICNVARSNQHRNIFRFGWNSSRCTALHPQPTQ